MGQEAAPEMTRPPDAHDVIRRALALRASVFLSLRVVIPPTSARRFESFASIRGPIPPVATAQREFVNETFW